MTWDWEVGIWDRDLEFGIEIRDWYWGLRWRAALGIGIGD